MFWLTFLKYFLYVIAGIFLLILVFAAYLLWFQSAFYFPKPTGKYAVGVKTYHWIDTKRRETLHSDSSHPYRELMVNIWYPAQEKLQEKPNTPYALYLVDYFKKNLKRYWLQSGLSRPIYSYAQHGVKIATDVLQFPILIFSHGNGGTRDSNTIQCEELASQGYVVVGISHTYDSMVVEFPDGRIAEGLPSMIERAERSVKEKKSLEEDQNNGIEIWINDVHFVLDQLEQLENDKESMFYQRLDQKNIGIFGHSVGGSTAIQICRRDARVKVGVDLDGPLTGPDALQPFNKPLMFLLTGNFFNMMEQSWSEDDCKKFVLSCDEANMIKFQYFPSIKQLSQSIGPDAYIFVIKNAGHNDVSDVAQLKQTSLPIQLLKKIGLMHNELEEGSINSNKATEIVNTYLVNFFDKYLKGKPSELLDGKNKKYAEVETK